MTMHTGTPAAPTKVPPRGRRTMWAIVNTVAAILCGIVVVAKFTWATDMNPDGPFWAGLGVIGFTANAINYWQPPQDARRLWDVWWTTVFWTYFGLGLAAGAYWQTFHADDGPPGFMLALLAFFAALCLWAAAEEGRKAWSETKARRAKV